MKRKQKIKSIYAPIVLNQILYKMYDFDYI